MSTQKKLEKVLEHLLSEDTDKAYAVFHDVVIEKARAIYESMMDDEQIDEAEDDDEVGGDPSMDFTKDIKSSKDDISNDEENAGEANDDFDFATDAANDDDFGGDETADDAANDGEFGNGESLDDEERINNLEDQNADLQSQLDELRAEFDRLMGEELQEPQHADLADEYSDTDAANDDEFDPAANDNDFEQNQDEIEQEKMFEKKKAEKLKVAKQAKKGDLKPKNTKKVDEETNFLTKVSDTGQRSTAKLVGTGKGASLGAEQNKSPYTNIPARKDYGGKPVKFGSGTGGEYGKYSSPTVKKESTTDNTGIKPKSVSKKADTTAKFTDGKSAGASGNKSPLSNKPSGSK